MLGSINNRGKVSEPCLSSPIITLHRGTLSIPPTVTVENELPADSDFKLDLYDYVLSRSTVRPGAETVVKGTDSYTLTDSDLMKFHLMTNTTGGMTYYDSLFELYLDGNAIKMRAK